MTVRKIFEASPSTFFRAVLAAHWVSQVVSLSEAIQRQLGLNAMGKPIDGSSQALPGFVALSRFNFLKQTLSRINHHKVVLRFFK